ncbi:MAG TPA: class I SAM-dependent rRNA methyltransferase [Deltaproteobacteria bacterium]|nr:class I SAM-dependent rRNA methyltransferase [Deltaproteobacteria bacterium]
MLIVRLKPRKESPVLGGHPWIYSGAIDKVQGSPDEERLCRVIDAKGHFICQGLYNPISQIAVRVLTLGKETVDRSFYAARIRSAVEMRRRIMDPETSCYRLINSEGDLLPGLVVDLYHDVLVMQIATPGMEELKADLTEILSSLFPSHTIFERSNMRTRGSEGLRPSSGVLLGQVEGADISVTERGTPFLVDIFTGDRTGFYLEHRDIRQRVMSYARDKEVLDLFCYTGAFSICALKGGARSVVSVESSSPAQALLKKNMELHKIKPFVWRHIKEDVFRFLGDDRGSYDLVLCDPPAFNKELDEHLKVLGLAMTRVKPGGLLFSLAPVTSQFSPTDLVRAISRAAQNLSRKVRILEPLAQSADFPFLPSHPQGMQLAGFVTYLE